MELKVTATRKANAKAGGRVLLITELGGSVGSQRQSLQTAMVVFREPLDRRGNPVKVAHATNRIRG